MEAIHTRPVPVGPRPGLGDLLAVYQRPTEPGAGISEEADRGQHLVERVWVGLVEPLLTF